MLLPIPDVLNADEVAEARRIIAAGEWVDGRATAGPQSARVKDNAQLREDDPAAREVGALVVAALERHPLVISASLPGRVFPPLVNRYRGGQGFGTHVDNAIRQVTGTPHRLRTDVSATLFLSAASEYDGGELVVEDTYGVHRVKLEAGGLILYPATSLHHVLPVTRGTRLACFFWIQSLVRDDAQRTLLFDLDTAIQRLGRDLPAEHPSLLQLTGVYHNLLRRWADL